MERRRLKLIQHKDRQRDHGAIAGLRGQTDAGSDAVADLMQETQDARAAAMDDAQGRGEDAPGVDT